MHFGLEFWDLVYGLREAEEKKMTTIILFTQITSW